jgi:8-oxo-dGTP pyrophosphatase MutT (NUDIX family)
MVPTKACPVLFSDSTFSKILVFRHPRAGVQLVKGGIESGETPAAAALRELREESGICDAKVKRDLGVWAAGIESQIWSFHLCSTPRTLPSTWIHHADDDGGLDLNFYWHVVNEQLPHDSNLVFQRAIRYVLDSLFSADSTR